MKLEIDNIELNFDGKKILWGVYLKAEKGKITSILGRNGSGKTSLFKIIFGNLNPKYATIRINSKYSKRPLYKSRNITFLPQHAMLPKNMRLKQAFLCFGVEWESFTSIFKSFSSYEANKISSLSTGEVRIVETYLVLKRKSDIVLLDEPFSFIAPVYIEKIKQLINQEKEKKILLITDHYYKEILEISDNLYLLKDGISKKVRDKNTLLQEGYLPSSR